MINIPIFEPLDIPPDIQYEISSTHDFYIFTKKSVDNTFVKFIFQINPETKLIECIDNDTKFRIYDDIEISGNNVNDFLWKISDCNYSERYLRLEVIERIRRIKSANSNRDIIDYIKKYNYEFLSDSDEEN